MKEPSDKDANEMIHKGLRQARRFQPRRDGDNNCIFNRISINNKYICENLRV